MIQYTYSSMSERIHTARFNEDRLLARANGLAHMGRVDEASHCFKKALVYRRYARLIKQAQKDQF